LQVEERVETTLIDRLVEFLSTKRLLLLLDNCEHLLDSVNELLEAILGRTTNLDVLATSRQRLGATGEQLLPVQPLPVPGDDPAASPAIALFADRAAAVRPDFALTDDNLVVVAALCRHLEGLPLALELAAARSVSWTPAEILAEVTDRAGSLADRRRRIDRHRSMSSVVAWSYDLLPPDEQAVCQRLAIFAGGWTADAASTVVARDDLPGTAADEADEGDEGDRIILALTALVEHSLIAAHNVVGRTRFSMLEPVRQYAEARLSSAGGADQARARHASWAVAFMETADAGLRGPDEAHWATAIDAELANLRAAHQWCLAHDADRAARLAGALFWYGYWYAPSEVFGWADQTVEHFADAGQPPLTGAFATAALGAWRRGDLTRARTLALRGIETAPPDDPTSARFAWEALRTIEGLQGNYKQALACHQQALALARQVGDRCHEAHEHIVGALALGYLGKIDQAQTELDAATRLLDASDYPSVRALCDYAAGEILVAV
jgi:predicted ATPase